MEFTRHQDDLALARFRDAGGFDGDRLTDVALKNLHGPRARIRDTVVERSDLAEANLEGSDLGSATFVSANLRSLKLGRSLAERVEIYYSELNEADLRGIYGRRIRVSGSQAMNLKLDESNLAVVRFEETPLIRASFQRALLTRVSFSDTRMGGTALDRASFHEARLFDCSFRGANLRGASFRGALLVGCDFGEALLEGASFRGATLVATALPPGIDTTVEAGVEF